MKKRAVILSILFVVIGISTQAAKQINTFKKNPSPQGTYKDVQESHSQNGQLHSLSCENSGDKTCAWETSPWLVTSYNNVDEAVQNYIASGIPSGTEIIEGASVSWNAINLEEYSFTIIVEEE